MGIKRWVCDVLNCSEFEQGTITEYQKKIDDLNRQLTNTTNQYVQLLFSESQDKAQIHLMESEIHDLSVKIEDLQTALSQVPPAQIPNQYEEYYDKKISPIIAHYSGRFDYRTDKQVSTDVRTFFMNPQNDADLVQLCKDIGITDSDSSDVKVQKIQSWVAQHISYNYDSFTSKVDEYWQLPYELLATRKGDCEDGAILMANLALAAGVPIWRVRINAGDVEYQGSTAGHAWMTYCRETDNKFVIIDWCYNADISVPIANKPYWKDVSMYKTIWFSFNQKKAYSDLQSMVFDQDEFNKFKGVPA